MKFSEIIGQLPVKNYLINTVKNSRVSHAQLFYGPEGCGKLALAIAYAQFISCTNKQWFDNNTGLTADSCGTCPSCVKYSKLVHPDLHFFYPVTTTKDVKSKPRSTDYIQIWRETLLGKGCYVSLNDWYDALNVENKQGINNPDDCDDIVKKVSLTAYESDYKIVMIWMVEKLFHAAAPKILKILEEPPDKTLFILISEKHEQIINTIISRTQMVKIPRLSDKDINDTLIRDTDVSEIRARKISTIANGNYIYAKMLTKEEDDDEDYNFIAFRQWMRLCFRLKPDDILELVKFVDEIAKIGREKQKSFFSYALKVLRNAAIINQGDAKLVNTDQQEIEFINGLSTILTPGRITKLNTGLNNAIYHIERNANPRITFMHLSFELHRIMQS